MHRVPPIVDLGFLYPKLSQIFYQQYSLKKLKIWYCRSCYIQDQLLLIVWSFEWDFRVTNVSVCVQQIQIEEFMNTKLRAVTWVSTTRGSFRFREKFIVKLLFYHSEFVALRIVWVKSLPGIFTLKLDCFIGFPRSLYRLSSLLFHT